MSFGVLLLVASQVPTPFARGTQCAHAPPYFALKSDCDAFAGKV